MSARLQSESRSYVAGHTGLVGGAVLRLLRARGFQQLLVRARAELDLTDAGAVQGFFAAQRPEYVVLAACR